MSAQYNPDECARLIAEAREDDARMDPNWRASEHGPDNPYWFVSMNPGFTMTTLTPERASAIARTRNNLGAVADQLEAASAEVKRLYTLAIEQGERAFLAERERDKLQADLESARKDAEHWREARRVALEGGEVLKAELEAARQRIAALEAEAERNKLWSCPDCEFTFAAYHTNADGSMSCPVCEVEAMRREMERLRSSEGRFEALIRRLEHLATDARNTPDAYRAARDKRGG